MKRLLKSHIALLAWRLALLYAVLAICRAIFWRYNYAGIGPLADAELPALARGALLFDTVSVLYANALLIVLSLIPLHLRERRWWQRMLYFYYVVVNALLVVAVNLGDAVYFRYTQKRFTAEEIFFADNDNSLQLVGKFMAENIPLLLAGIGLIALLALAGGRKARPEPLCRRPLCYYGGGTVLLVVAALLSVAGMRGGVTRMTRPVTLSNATLYASDNARANLILSNPFCILRTVGSGGKISYERYFAPEELDGIYTPVHRPGSVGAAPLEGRNVVVFVMESMSAEHSALLHPELYADRQVKGYTPFLDSLMQAGYCFERMYANGTRSIQALPAVLGSIPSFKTPFVLMPQALAPTRQLPRRRERLRHQHEGGLERGDRSQYGGQRLNRTGAVGVHAFEAVARLHERIQKRRVALDLPVGVEFGMEEGRVFGRHALHDEDHHVASFERCRADRAGTVDGRVDTVQFFRCEVAFVADLSA